MKENKIKIIHIVLLVLGTGFLASGAFHSGLWFDESYTVGLIKHNLIDMCRIATYDVHPHLYYILLKLFSYIFGSSIISLRLFSVLGAVILALLGFTHIRKDFGVKTGFWFSFFVLFMPSTFKYAQQIRMYTWAPLFVTLAAIYAYRLAIEDKKNAKNSILFVTFSVMAAYTHYYALVAVSIINIMLFIYYIVKKSKLKNWFIMAVVQLGVFLPGLLVFLKQSSNGSTSWIKVIYPDILFDTISFHFIGVPQTDILVTSPIYVISLWIGTCIYVIFGILLIRMKRKHIDDTKPVLLALVIYFGVIVLFLIVSISRPTYYVRYSIVSYGLLLFAFAYLLARYHKAYLKVVVVVLILGISIARAISIYEVNYDTSNTQVDDYLEANIQDGDIILFNNFMEFAITVKYQHVPTYFYNVLNWDVEKPYQALGKNVVITRNLDELKNYKGRIWIISKDYGYNKIMSYPGTKEVSSEKFNYKYYSDSKELNIILVEKK
ncbi:glycosyltransferase family 39 protein [[Clostridium] fimetarium]|uniref:Dolichyl-phosphate-mannose-protein mannosyltransferase n=1 Tax=[Clostridium] fimetarium TaxID=99656 RepID=A0A1I0MVZ6_9FIRM|nr:glycosyltransferase family 39 protein [[Clostridium] fimetarium]SEV93040.1 Dolichyl-phosphate-mannose-protein mannosyltransferase [[Clostridium] fimetarium]